MRDALKKAKDFACSKQTDKSDTETKETKPGAENISGTDTATKEEFQKRDKV